LPQQSIDERGFSVLQAIRQLQPANRRLSLSEAKALFRDQYLLLRLDEKRAIAAIPRLLPDDQEQRRFGWQAVQDVVTASDTLSDEGQRRLRRIGELFGIAPASTAGALHA
jgi:hypothetical protein